MLASSASDQQANILKVLAAGGPPLRPPQIARALPVGGRPRPGELQGLLAQLAADGRILRFPGRSDRYVAAPVENWARATLLAALLAGPQPAARLARSLGGHFSHLAAGLLESLAREGLVFRHPALKRSGRPAYALTPPDPLAYLAGALDRLLQTVADIGFSAQAVRAAALRHLSATTATAATEQDAATSAASPAGVAVAAPAAASPATPVAAMPSQAVPVQAVPVQAVPVPAVPVQAVPVQAVPIPPAALLEAMSRAEPRVHDGAAVSIGRLREMLGGGYDKKSFDEALLLLAARGVVELQSHAWPARLTPEQQKQLIDNGQGGWFDSAALQRRKSP
jgi:hypothetical protein